MLFYYLVPCVVKYLRLDAIVTENKAVKESVKMIRTSMTKATIMLIAAALIASVLALSAVHPIAAQSVACGDTITQSLKLVADIGPCSGDGITIGADNITLDCNGHTVSGSGTGFGSGISVPPSRSGVTIKNCQVTEFGGAGFSVFGLNNKLRGNTAENNGGSGFAFGGVGNINLKGNTAENNGGSGFAFEASTDNNLKGNTAVNNGGAGFLLTEFSHNNNLEGNTADNNLEFGYSDDSSGTGTANIYIGNECSGNGAGGSSPTGLCEPQA